jgi:two-component system, OmpR family, KDP operon response regulator KdpE
MLLDPDLGKRLGSRVTRISKQRVLLVEEPSLEDALTASLDLAGYEVSRAETGNDGIRVAAQSCPDLILLHSAPPHHDSEEVIRWVREWNDAPIVVLSPRDDEADCIRVLDLGADDYIAKPFGLREFQARIRAALRKRRFQPAWTAHLVADLDIDFERREANVQGQARHLSPKECGLLACLISHAGKAVGYRQLLAAGWGGAVTNSQHVRSLIGQLREKLEVDPNEPELIQTEAGFGYRIRCSERSPSNVLDSLRDATISLA